ncbi:zinc transporter [Litorivivens lipolytica]|uniref:Zinc transporter n=1 Tax=Litorivivens lipolytica TaxID=1524264 RepID=A0A7W4W6E0_9GAMM|nr:zinc transporter ZntB [Litorivivens lipolytica]MBB3048326.1 zinc transporter [Litorivivens lipolytica]
MLDGLIYAFLFDGDGGAKELQAEEIEGWAPDQGLLWLHFDYSKAEAQHWITEKSDLDPIAVSALLAEETRPRASVAGKTLLMALRGVNMNPGADPEDMVSIRLWSDGKRIISSRRRRLLSVDDIISKIRNGTGPTTAAEFIALLAAQLTARMHDAIDELEDQVAELEEQVLTESRQAMRAELSDMRRELIALRRYIAPQREALNRIQLDAPSWFDDMQKLRMRETADRLTLYIEVLDSVRERAGVAQEELNNQISEEANRRMYVLSIVAAIFLPLGFFTGLLGINVGGMPGADNGWAFWFVCGICVAVVVWEVLLFRRKQWL